MNYHRGLVSVVILNYETFQLTVNCVNSVLKSLYDPIEIIVLDNGSRESSCTLFTSTIKDPRVRIYRSERNLGFAEGCNYAIKFCNGCYLMLLNSDTEVEPDFLNPLVRFLDTNPLVAAAQSKLLSLQNKEYFEYAGAAGGLMDVFGYPFTRGRIFKTVEKDTGQYNTKMKISWSVGAAMFIRKSTVDRIGLFDPIYFTYGEEADFCFRSYMCGWEVFSVPESIVYHLGAATSGKNIVRKLHYNHRNGWVLILKNYPMWLLLLVFPLRLVFDSVNILYYLISNKAIYVISIFWAWLDLLILMPKIVKARIHNQRIVSKAHSKIGFPPIYKGSVLVDYFFKGKRTYNELVG